jgi:Spy/CpxP family protein refolding chaperone
MMRRALVAIAALALAQSTSAHAQLRPRRDAALPRANVGRQIQGNQQVGGNRAQLERQFQQMLFQMTRRRVGLTDAQMSQLVPVNQRFETQRRNLQRQERQTRLALRDAMRDSSQSDQGKITEYLDQLVQLQRQRVELFAQEQRDLAQFMTPLQRARYTALQEQVRRRVEQLRRQNGVTADSTLAKPPGH